MMILVFHMVTINENVPILLAKTVVIPLGLTEAAPATDDFVQKKVHVSRTTFIISNEQMKDIKKFGSLIKNQNVNLLAYP